MNNDVINALKNMASGMPGAGPVQDLLAISVMDAKLKETVLKIVKDTYEPEADSVNSYFVRLNGDKELVLDVDYLVWAADSHTCVDYSETCVIPLSWLAAGFDYKFAYRKLMLDKYAKALEEARDDKADAENRLKEIQDKESEILGKIAALNGGASE